MPHIDAMTALGSLWQQAGLPDDALGCVQLTGADPVLPSSFAVGTAAQASIAAAALAACELGHARGAPRQGVALDMRHATLECTGWFSLDGQVPDPWDAFSGLYRCADGHVRIHANFRHHREGAHAVETGQVRHAGDRRARWIPLEWPGRQVRHGARMVRDHRLGCNSRRSVQSIV
jgi:hypothetical protein